MYLKFNAVLRGLQFKYMRVDMITLCCSVEVSTKFKSGEITFEVAVTFLNKYTTTLHCVNSFIIKMSKLCKAVKVYRGVSGGMLPEACRTPNEYGVKGGIEGGFMSTTTDGETALFYAKGGADKSKRGGPAILFESQMGMVDRGGVQWTHPCPLCLVCSSTNTSLTLSHLCFAWPLVLLLVRMGSLY